MSKIRFYNAKILTMEEPVKVIEDGELWTDGKVIEYAGPKEDAPKDRPSFDREIDC
ncbi:MAG TPA: amidohydrolase, partial [Lachnospiraceae bacterium]|nr:amidohydrolase [Lachnospiraceae bacterium]